MLTDGGEDNILEVSLSAQLIEDYLSVRDAPVPALGEGNIAAFSNGVVAVDGSRLLLCERDWSVPSGWRTTALDVPRPDTATGGTIAAVHAFEVRGSSGPNVGVTTLNVLCLFAAPGGCQAVSWLVRATIDGQPPGPWQPVQNCDAGAKGLLSQVKQVGAFDGGPNVGVVLYGITNAILPQQEGIVFAIGLWNYGAIFAPDNWTILSRIERSRLPSDDDDARIALVAAMTSAGPDHPYAIALCCYDGTAFHWSPLAPGACNLATAGSWRSHKPEGDTIGQLVASPAGDQGIPDQGGHVWDVFAVGSRQNLWRYSIDATSLQSFRLIDAALPPATPPRMPAGVTHMSLNTHEGARAAFVTDGDDALWMLRDITSETATWIRLGNRVKAISAPSPTGRSAEVYCADARSETQNVLFHLSQSPINRTWQNERIAVFIVPDPTDPKNDLKPVSTVSLEIAVTAPDGRTPIPHADVTVAADQPTTLIGRDAAFRAGPGLAPVVRTDASGRATLRYWARTMSFPTLTFTAAGISGRLGAFGSGSRSCQGDIVETDAYAPPSTSLASRLGGDDDGTASNGFSLTPETLKQKGLLPADTKDDDGRHVVGMLNTIGGYMKRRSPAYRDAGTTTQARRWQLSFGQGGSGLTCREVPADLPGALDGSWEDIAGDVLHWVKHSADAVAEWTVHVADEAIHFVVAGYRCVLRTVHEAAELAGTLLQSIQHGLKDAEAFIRDVIDFFKVLFDWKDILATHAAFRHIFKFLLTFASDKTTITAFVDDHLNDVKTDIDTAIGQAKAYLRSATASASSYTAAQPVVGTVSNDLSTKQYRTHMDQHGARCHYVLSHSRNHPASTPAKLSLPSGQQFPPASVRKWHADPNNNHRAKKLYEGLKTPPGREETLLTAAGSALTDLLTVIEDLMNAALGGIEVVVDELIDLVCGIVADLLKAITTPIDVPLVSWLYKHVITDGDDLTILDLLCLIIAAPATILFKLVTEAIAPLKGCAPFTAILDQVTSLYSRGTAQAAPGAPSPAAVKVEAEVGAASLPATNIVAMTLGITSGVVGLFASGLSTYLDYKAIDGAIVKPPEPPIPPSTTDTCLGWASWAGGLLATGLAVPFSNFAALGNPSTADIVQCSYFGSQLLPITSDFLSLTFTEQLTKQNPGFGPIAEGLFGCLIAGFGATNIVLGEPDSGWDIANVVLTVFPRPWRMIIAGVSPETAEDMPVVMGIIMITDAIGLLGGTTTEIGAAVVDNRGS